MGYVTTAYPRFWNRAGNGRFGMFRPPRYGRGFYLCGYADVLRLRTYRPHDPMGASAGILLGNPGEKDI